MSTDISIVTCSPLGASVRRAPDSSEIVKIDKLRAAILELHGNHGFEFGGYDSLHEALIARCTQCHQLVHADFNPWPKPWLFGRRAWKPIRLSGLPVTYYCGYSQQMLAVFDPGPAAYAEVARAAAYLQSASVVLDNAKTLAEGLVERVEALQETLKEGI